MRKIIFSILYLLTFKVIACSCNYFPTLNEQYTQADNVVLATLKTAGVREYTWEISEVLKGSAITLSNYTTSKMITSCDVKLENEQEWLLFLKKNEKPVLGYCRFNRNTKYLKPHWRSDIKSNN